ncbi:TPA: tyrosine-type recombinase/integrase, partial [Streptococcus suis]
KELEDLEESDFLELNTESVQKDYLHKLRQDGNSDYTIRGKLKSVSSFFRFLDAKNCFKSVNFKYMLKYVLSTNKLADDSKETKAMTVNDYHSMKEWLVQTRFANNPQRGIGYSLLLEFMWITASRINAVFSLTWEDFRFEKDSYDVEGWTVYVRDKGNKINKKPLLDDTFYDRLKEALYSGNPKDEVFGTLSKRGFGDLLKEFSEPYGGDLTPHSVKKGAVTHVYRMTKDIVLCRKLADHEDIRTTLHYIEDEDDRLSHGSLYLVNTESDYEDVKKAVGEEMYNMIKDSQRVSLLAQLSELLKANKVS